MEFVAQNLDDLVASLSPLKGPWQDELASRVIDLLEQFPVKRTYEVADVAFFLARDFEAGFVLAQLFLGVSQDELQTDLGELLGPGGIGVMRFARDQAAYLGALSELGLLKAMVEVVNRRPVWSDILVERLRSGRGKAIRGQKRGRWLEDFTEAIIKEVFGTAYETRCQFSGVKGYAAKCDFSIPNRRLPRILVEVKGYGATGSKMSDIVGDVDAIIRAKRNDTTLILVTDGVTWRRRLSDLAKLVERQNDGRIGRIYTTKMGPRLREDLEILRAQYRLS